MAVTGWGRTLVLSGGAALGVLGAAAFIHLCKKSPEEPPYGWDRTVLLGFGALGGTLATALILHAVQYGG